MDLLERQNRSKTIQRIAALLREMPLPRKSESEWNALEESILARLAQDSSVPVVLRREYAFRSFTRVAIAAAACIILTLNTYILFNAFLPAQSPVLENSSVLDVRGTARLVSSKGASRPLDPPHLSFRLAAGTSIETGAGSEVTAQLADGTGFKLSADSRMEILWADKRGIRLALHYGDVLFSVRKQGRGSEFVVMTPNAECRVIGTIFQLTVDKAPKASDARTDLAVFQGVVRISDKMRYDVSTSVETGFMVSLQNHRFDNQTTAHTSAQRLRDISVLKLALELSQDSFAMPHGMVEFSSEPPEACVTINGQVLGTTPIVTKFPAGNFEVEISREGFKPWRGNVSVENLRASVITAHLEPTRSVVSQARKAQTAAQAKQAAEAVEQAENMPEGFVNNPDYVEALIQMTIGEYRKALGILEQLRENAGLSTRDRAQVMKQASLCYRSLGNFRQALRELKRQYRRTNDPEEKSRMLWEMATIQATCLGDYTEAEKTLNEYLQISPDGPWADNARERLAEVRCLIDEQAREQHRQ